MLAKHHRNFGLDLFRAAAILMVLSPRAWLVFMLRRWLRTVPAYYAWLAVLTLASLATTAEIEQPLYLLFLQNFAWPMVGGDWFAVSWSLAIEEWFYLLFSLALLGLAPILGQRALPVAIALFMAVPLAVRIALAPDAAGWDLLGSETTAWDHAIRKIVAMRLDAIAYGVCLAWLWSSSMRERIERLRWPLAAAGLAMLAFARPPFGAGVWRVWIFPLTSVGFACLFPLGLVLSASDGPLSDLIRRLSNGSYAIYLVHFTLLAWTFAAVQDGWIPAWTAIPLALAATFLLAGASYRWLEMPILRRRPKQLSRGQYPAAAAPPQGKRQGQGAAKVSLFPAG